MSTVLAIKGISKLFSTIKTRTARREVMSEEFNEKTKATIAAIAAIMGITSIIAFGYFTNVGAAIALFFTLFADNIAKDRGSDEW